MSIPSTPSPRASLPSYGTGAIIADKYTLLHKAGEGGMGAVWVAENLSLQVPVAIKLLRGEGRSACAPERLLREARATALLHHPAVVRVFDFGETENHDPFIVMELLHGESLRDVLERETSVEPARAIQLFLPLIDGLSSAHAHGIVHRDLKPDNLFLAREDSGRLQPKVVDFGVAKLLQPSARNPVTRNGMLVGSPEYMSPEQARGLDIDERSDVWALCVALYETIAGYRPFDGATAQELLLAVIQSDAIALDDRHGVDPDLWAILARGMSKDREVRFASMKELGRALATWLVERGVTEDVCGASLRATWLEDAEAQARRAMVSGHSPARGIAVPVISPIAPTAVEELEAHSSNARIVPTQKRMVASQTLDGASSVSSPIPSFVTPFPRPRLPLMLATAAAVLAIGWVAFGKSSPMHAASAAREIPAMSATTGSDSAAERANDALSEIASTPPTDEVVVAPIASAPKPVLARPSNVVRHAPAHAGPRSVASGKATQPKGIDFGF